MISYEDELKSIIEKLERNESKTEGLSLQLKTEVKHEPIYLFKMSQ